MDVVSSTDTFKLRLGILIEVDPLDIILTTLPVVAVTEPRLDVYTYHLRCGLM